MSEMKARILGLPECLHHDGRRIWLETIDQGGQVIPVTFYAERMPYLKFDAQDRVMMIEVRSSCYGETWRCWNVKPETTDWAPVEPEKKAAKKPQPVKRPANPKKKPAGK